MIQPLNLTRHSVEMLFPRECLLLCREDVVGCLLPWGQPLEMLDQDDVLLDQVMDPNTIPLVRMSLGESGQTILEHVRSDHGRLDGNPMPGRTTYAVNKWGHDDARHDIVRLLCVRVKQLLAQRPVDVPVVGILCDAHVDLSIGHAQIGQRLILDRLAGQVAPG